LPFEAVLRRHLAAMTLRARTTLGGLHRATPWVWLN
jgi:hypothetical protein